MVRRPSLPKVRTPKTPRGSTRGRSRTSAARRRKRKVDVGDIAEGVLGALGSLFGGSSSRSAALGASASASPIGGGSRGSGKANYGPLPSFNIRSKTVRKYGNPTLAIISLQIAELLHEMGLIESTLMEQLKQQQHIYKENARVQREINAESPAQGIGFVPFVSPSGEGAQLGALSIKQLNDSYLKFGKALDDATGALNNMDCSCDGGDIDLPVFLPSDDDDDKKKKKRKTNNITPYERVAKADALQEGGGLKPGYIAKKDSLGRTYYIKQGGIEGAIRRKAPGLGRFIFGRQAFDFTDTEIKRLTQKGYTQSGLWWRGPDGRPVPKNELIQAAKNPVARVVSSFTDKVSSTVSRITKPLTEKITSSRGYQVATRVGRAAVTKIKSFASTIKGLAQWAWDGVDEVFSKLKGKTLDFFNKFIVRNPKFGQVCSAIKKAAGSKWAGRLLWFVFWLYALYEYGLRYYAVYKNRKNMSYQQISDEVTDISTDMVSQLGVAALAFIAGGFIGGMITGPGGIVTAIVGGIIGLVIDWIATAMGAKTGAAELAHPYIKQLVDFFTGQYAIKVNGEEANLSAPPPKPQVALTQTGSSGQGTVPFKKPAAAAQRSVSASLKSAPKETVGNLIDNTATRVGVDPALMNMIASENNAFDPKKQVQSVNGSEIFKLTPQQWSYITSQYGPRYPELYAGINDPKAATTAGALLIKDSQEFLTKNNIPASPLSLYGSYLFGYDGLRKLLNAQPADVASAVLPEAAQVRPELFKDKSGDITAGTLVQKLYNKTLPAKQTPAGAQGTPAIPTYTTPKIDGLPPQQKPPAPPASTGGGGTPPVASPEASPAPASPAPSGGDAKPAATSAGKEPTGEMVPSTPDTPVPPSATAAPGVAIDERTKEIEQAARDAQAIADNPLVIQAMGGNRRTPAVLPSQSAGYTGTGNVPDPSYIFMDQYEYQFRFKSSPVSSTLQTSWA